MKKEGPQMPYIFGEPEGMGRKEPEELREEASRLAGGERRAALRKKREAMGRKNAVTRGKEEISLSDVPEEDLVSDELNPEQALELKTAIRHGYVDTAQNPREDIEIDTRTEEGLRRKLAEKELKLRIEKRKKSRRR